LFLSVSSGGVYQFAIGSTFVKALNKGDETHRGYFLYFNLSGFYDELIEPGGSGAYGRVDWNEASPKVPYLCRRHVGPLC